MSIYKNFKNYLRSLHPSYYRKANRYKIPIKYVVSGGTAAFVDLALLYSLIDIFKVYYLLSASIAFFVAFFISFYLQKFWTFRDNSNKQIYQQIFLYFSVGIVNLGINTGGMYVFVEHIFSEFIYFGKFNITYVLSQIIMGAFIAVISFLVYRFIIFKKRKRKKTKDNLKILIATGIFPPDIGGPAIYARALFDELPKLGCEIKVIAYGDAKIPNPKLQITNKSQIPNPKSQIYKVNRNQNIIIKYFKYFWQVWKLACWADAVYILDLMSAGAPAVLAAKLRGKKVVFRTGGDFLWEKAFQSGWTDLPLKQYYEAAKSFQEKILMSFCRCLLKKINLIIFSTKLQADIYQKYYSVRENKIKFIGNPAPLIKEKKYDGSYKESIVFAGRLIKLKNIKRMVNAFGKINNSKVKLLIFGEGPEKDGLITMISDLKLENRIKLVDKVGHNELIKIINSCKFFILPSLSEISPNLAFECLSIVKPIILTRETGLPDKIISQLMTVDPLSEDDIREKIEYLLKEENLYNYAEKLKHIKISQRSWKDIAKEHFNIFQEINK